MPEPAAPSPSHPIGELIFVKIPLTVAGVLFIVAMVINIVNVVGRYVFSDPVFWAEESLSFLLIWIVFLVAGTVTYRGAHLNMDLVYAILPQFWKRIINLAIAVAIVVFSFFVAYQSWKVVSLHYHNQSVTAGTNIPLVIPAAALLFGFTFIASAALVRFRSYLNAKFD
jgi:TRAP-type C4-dicarboxylate transport system permease small subunit